MVKNKERGGVEEWILACVILVKKCSVFSHWKLWPTSLILMAAEGLGEKEIFTKEAINVQTPNDNSDSKSDDWPAG